jgi:HYR domain/NHL repeat
MRSKLRPSGYEKPSTTIRITVSFLVLSILLLWGPRSDAQQQQLMTTFSKGAPNDPFSGPQFIAFDKAGNLFISDSGNHRVQRIASQTGVVTTVVGTGTAGSTGDGGPATQAQINCPSGLVFDGPGNLYVADPCQNVVRKVAPGAAGIISGANDELISTYAGNGSRDACNPPSGVPASQATVDAPTALAMDRSGNLYLVSDDCSDFIRRVDGGSGILSVRQDVGPLQPAPAMTFDSLGNLLVWDFGEALESCSPTVLANNDVCQTVSDGPPGLTGIFEPPAAIFDNAGNLYFSNGGSDCEDGCATAIYKLTPTSGAIGFDSTYSVYAGNGQPGYSGDGGSPLDAELSTPIGLVFNGGGNLFISDSGNNVIRAVLNCAATPAGNSISVSPLDQLGTQRGDIAITFDSVITAGCSVVITGQPPAPLPGGFQITGAPAVTFDITSSAHFAGNVTVCLTSNPLSPAARLLEFNKATQGWDDVTLSVDSATGTICGQSTSLSAFAIAAQNQALPVLTAHPSNPTNQNTATFSFTDSDPTIASFLCTLDGTTAPCVSGVRYPSLADGLHAFSVVAQTAGGVSGPTTSFSWVIDTIAPPVPTLTSHPANPSNSASASFAFTDADASVSFSCSLDGVTASCTNAASYSALSATMHTFIVIAADAAGNVSAPTTFTWTVDTTPPPVPSIDSHPTNPSATANAAFAFSDAEAGVRLSCQLDGVSVACTSPIIYPGLADGGHTFSVFATDGAGNSSAPNTFAWTIGTTAPPSPHIDSAPAALSNQVAPSFTFSDGQAGVTFICQIDGAQPSPCTAPAIYVGLPDGLNTFSVAASDPTSGRSSAPATYTWTKDTTPPKVGIQGAPATVVIPNVSTVNFSGGSPDIVGFQCSLDGAAYAPCSSPFTQAINIPGGHTFSVEAVDAAGNVSDPETTGWNVTYCHCDLVGGYSNPAFNDQVSTTSQNFQVRVTYAANGLDLADISVVQAGNGAVVYTLPSTARGWQFSPDQTHFVFLDSLPYPNSPVEATVLDLSSTPAKRILTVSNVGGALEFSPSGVYLMVVGAPVASGNSSQYSVSVYRVGDVSQGALVYSTTSFGATAAWGFSSSGVQEAETSFLFAFASGQETVTWNVGYLPTGKQTISQTSTLGNAFWQFNPCGNIIALISNKPGFSEQVDLFSTETGTHLGGTSFPVQNVTLSSTVDQGGNPEEVGNIINPLQTIVIFQNKCSANTPTGSNVSISPTCSQTNSNPVSVTFSDVTQEGGTGVNESPTGNAPPGDFQIGNPPVYYDIATSATYSGDITICISYAGITFSGTPRLFHFENGAWVDRTTSVDTTTQSVCATVSSLSPFALFSEPAGQTPAITSADNVTFQVGAAGGFTILSSGSPTSALSESGALPNGIHYIDNGDGSAILTGTPTAGGTFNLTLSASNTAGNATQNFVLTVNGTTNHPPTANAGTNQIMEATSPAGAVVTLSGSGSDPDNDSLTFTWSENGSNLGTGAQITVTLPIGMHTITLIADDGRGGTGTSTVQISVQDTKPPVFTPPASQTLEATSPTGAIATFSATATDIVDGARPVICSPASGSTFPLGATTVNCTSTDVRGNSSSASFTITVRDITPPFVTPPASISIPATEAGGTRGSAWPALAAFLAGATAKDNIDSSPVPLPPQFGNASVNNNTLFPYGPTTVTFEFRDASGNVGSATAMVNVILGTVKLSANVAGQGKNADGTSFVDLTVSNVGTGNARKLRVDLVAALPTRGNGIVKVVSPAFPTTIGIGNLDSGASQTIRIVLKVPATVKQFQLAEVGAFVNVKGSPDIFAFVQTLTP